VDAFVAPRTKPDDIESMLFVVAPRVVSMRRERPADDTWQASQSSISDGFQDGSMGEVLLVCGMKHGRII
jgi:hypothetical protein